MRVLAAAWSIAILAIGMVAAPAAQDPSPPVQAAAPLARVPPQLSDVLVHSPLGTCSTADPSTVRVPARLRVATWNIRAARSAPVEAVAAELAAMQADVFALQEVDHLTRRSEIVDQPAALASALGFHYVFAASIKWEDGDYGLAVLSRFPLTEVRRHRLDATTANEPRIVLEAAVCANGRPLRVFDHHADGWAASRELGFTTLKGILQPHMERGILVAGDFNEAPEGPGVAGLLGLGLVDLAAEAGVSFGRRRVDHLLADRPLARSLSPARVWPTDKSDHNAVLIDLEW